MMKKKKRKVRAIGEVGEGGSEILRSGGAMKRKKK
jgi:hypothetical protein